MINGCYFTEQHQTNLFSFLQCKMLSFEIIEYMNIWIFVYIQMNIIEYR